jgi:16S rRNA (guanine527-N7)-methyltransferase
VFGDRFDLARQYVTRLADEGVAHGFIGPREVPRLWDRHLLNSAVLTDLIPVGVRVIDVGSGAGLPGIAMAIRRPDLVVELLEPMLRRTTFLTAVVEELDLSPAVRVVRGRAEDAAIRAELGGSDWVVARAVAPLDRLVKWCLPLMSPGGCLLALKGERAAAEVAEHRAVLRRLGAGEIGVQELGSDVLVEPTWVVKVERPAMARGQRPRRGRQ